MGFFSKKQKVDVALFCSGFYDNYIFAPNTNSEDPHLLYCNAVYKQLANIETSFNSIDHEKFKFELHALRMEVVGTAWSHSLKDKYTLAISEFTKNYLFSSNRENMWEQMGIYNRAVAQSATINADTNSKSGRFQITFINQMRAGLFDEWIEKGHDSEASARAANRIGSETSWNKYITHNLLADELYLQLDYEPSDKLLPILTTVIDGYYNGAMEVLDQVKIIL